MLQKIHDGLLCCAAIAAIALMIQVVSHPTVGEAQASTRFRTVTDISGTGSVVNIGTGQCMWLQIYAPLANVSAVRFGDSNISTTRGSMIEKGYGEFTPSLPGSKIYDMATSYVLVQTGDKATVLCGY